MELWYGHRSDNATKNDLFYRLAGILTPYETHLLVMVKLSFSSWNLLQTVPWSFVYVSTNFQSIREKIGAGLIEMEISAPKCYQTVEKVVSNEIFSDFAVFKNRLLRGLKSNFLGWKWRQTVPHGLSSDSTIFRVQRWGRRVELTTNLFWM